MGLDISSRQSKYHYSYGYGGLHRIRSLAYKMFGGKEWSVGKETFDWPFVLACTRFTNLMMHSDCAGSYTQKGEVDFTGEHLLDGSLPGLLKELSIIKRAIGRKEIGEDGIGVKELNDLYQLVADANKKKGSIHFS